MTMIGLSTIDVVSDVICPWCFIGQRRLEAALVGLEGPRPEVRWRPFFLDGTIPEAGMPRAQYLSKKFGSHRRVAELHAPIIAAGRELGIDFALDKIMVTPNTENAHRLIRWAQAAGKQNETAERLFRLYWTEGQDIGERAVLVQAAGDVGLDGAFVAQSLAGNADRDAVRAEIEQAHALGIAGVPTFIIASRYAVIGAQGPEVLKAAIMRARLESRAGAGVHA